MKFVSLSSIKMSNVEVLLPYSIAQNIRYPEHYELLLDDQRIGSVYTHNHLDCFDENLFPDKEAICLDMSASVENASRGCAGLLNSISKEIEKEGYIACAVVSNSPSQAHIKKVFENAGYEYLDNEVILNQSTMVYHLTKLVGPKDTPIKLHVKEKWNEFNESMIPLRVERENYEKEILNRITYTLCHKLRAWFPKLHFLINSDYPSVFTAQCKNVNFNVRVINDKSFEILSADDGIDPKNFDFLISYINKHS